MSKSTLEQVKLSVKVICSIVAQFFGFIGGSEWVSDHCAPVGVTPLLDLYILEQCVTSFLDRYQLF